MPPYVNPLDPVALPGQAIRFEPSNDVHEVQSIEQMGRIGPVDYGSATSGNDATENSSSIIDLEDELEMEDNHIGQFIVNPLSLVEVEIRQTGDQDQRMVNKNQVGVITPYDPPNQRLIWVLASSGIQAIITNPQTWDMAKTLLYYTGFKYVLDPEPMSPSQVERLSGVPASVPVDSLTKRADQGATA